MSEVFKWTIAAIASVLVAVAAPAMGEQPAAGLEQFFGRYQGTGIVESSDENGGSMSLRNLDVVIARAPDDGFRVQWTALIRRLNGNVPSYVRKAVRQSYFPIDRPGVYRGAESGDPMAGESLNWARISGQTLTVYQLVRSDEGGFEVLSYERTLTDGGMHLVFRRLSDGEEVRTVEGALKRVGD